MSRIVQGASMFVRRVNAAMALLGGLGILCMGLLLFYEVAARSLFGSPTTWSQEIAQYIFIWAMLASAGYTLIDGKHIAIDIVVGKMSPAMQRVCALFTALAGFAFSAAISWQAWEMLEKTIRYNRHSPTTLNMPLWAVHSAVLVGFALLTLQYFFIILEKCCPCSHKSQNGGTGC